MEDLNSRYFVEKCCPCCGKYYIDNSHNRSKVACSPKCRTEWYNFINPDKHKATKTRNKFTVFSYQGIAFTDEEKIAIEEEIKSDVCPICGREMIGRKAHIDHDHKTNKFRGVICRNCNLALGLMEDNIDYLKKMVEYLSKP
jgi:predicted RNA-binding Zn-ribbon protein involved in translation (DUF1610 family)